jgi:hypothetical protein
MIIECLLPNYIPDLKCLRKSFFQFFSCTVIGGVITIFDKTSMNQFLELLKTLADYLINRLGKVQVNV